MWHGLARTGRDFDCIAAALADRFHIICPDTIGRGLSAWSDRPDEDYCLDAYARLASGVADAAGFQDLHWLRIMHVPAPVCAVAEPFSTCCRN
jgi:pimeloyl-ACP methyl ester carboxylesterase